MTGAALVPTALAAFAGGEIPILGSVTQKVLTHSKLPVLVYR